MRGEIRYFVINQFNGHYVSHYVSKNGVEQLLNFN